MRRNIDEFLVIFLLLFSAVIIDPLAFVTTIGFGLNGVVNLLFFVVEPAQHHPAEDDVSVLLRACLHTASFLAWHWHLAHEQRGHPVMISAVESRAVWCVAHDQTSACEA